MSSSSEPPACNPFLNEVVHRVNYGFFFGGMYITAILFGITVVQASTFFFVHRRDPMLHKAVVATVLIFDMAHLALVANSFFHYVVVNSGSTEPPSITWSCLAFYILETVTIAIAHCMYMFRLWTLAKGHLKRIQVIILQLLIASTLASGIIVSVNLGHKPAKNNFIEAFADVKLYPINFLNLGLNCVVDLSVVLLLVPALHGRTSVSWTSSTSMLLVAYALNTGMFNLFFSVGALIAFLAWRDSLLFFAPRVILMTVHVNSLLAMFNARHYFRSKSQTTFVLQAHETSITVSKFGEIRAKSHRSGGDEGPTINDAGLPLFSSDASQFDAHHPPLVEVNIHTTQDKRVSPSPDYPYTLPRPRA